MGHFLQSAPWEAFQKRLGRQVITQHGDGWSYRAVLERGTGNTRLYTPYGPLAQDETSFKQAVNSLKADALAKKATFLRIEPTLPVSTSLLTSLGFRPVSYQQLNPARTQIIDLRPPKDEILAQMSQNSRNLTRNYAKKGITIKTSRDPHDVSIFTGLMTNVARRNGITPHSPGYFQKQAEILFPLDAATLYYATYDDKPIAAAIVYDSDTTRYYAHGAADDAYRKLSPGTALVGEMILDAKDKGLTSFDLYGIAPENQHNHPWAGFTKFKQSFGGHSVDFAGTWDLPLKPVQYWLYRTYQSLRRVLR